jgi:hypothetical protein
VAARATQQLPVGGACSQTPPAAQLPSLPQGGLGVHWPAGAGMPATTSAQVPVACPVSAFEHAWQVPPHAVPQQTPSTQNPLAHSPPAEHAAAFCFWGAQAPPSVVGSQ